MIASYIALGAIVFFVARFASAWMRGAANGERPLPEPGKVRRYLCGFLAGALFANSIPHFIHGISGEYFPAPFGRNLGRGAYTDIANVLWGLFNFGAGYYYFRSFQPMPSRLPFRGFVLGGFVSASLFLSVVFSASAR
jgi:hypothetical protein